MEHSHDKYTLKMVDHPMSSEPRTETESVNRCQRALDDGTQKDPIEKLRLVCLARGASGFVGLGRALRRMDNDGSKSLSLEEFTKAIHDTGYECSDEEAEEMFRRFDNDGSGSIDMTEFLLHVRPPMNQRRLDIIGKCFAKLDKTGDGVITINELKHVYNVHHHPQYNSGEQSEEQILNRFMADFEEGGVTDGRVTEEDFFNYYAGISASNDNDTYFDLLLRQAYKL